MAFSQRLLFLPLALALTACDIPCFIMCTDQTRLQAAYVDQRDECRQLAEMKAGLAPGTSTTADKASKSKLVTLFSECMGTKGWTVPAGEEKKKDPAPAPAPVKQTAEGNPPVPPPNPKAQEAKLKRSADCAFARANASTSAISKKRAEACDIECTQMRKAAPEAPKPAACASD